MKWSNHSPASAARRRHHTAGFSMVELMVSLGLLTAIVLPLVWSLYLNGQVGFAALGNYQKMDVKSYMALDLLSREIRNSSQLTSYVTNQSLTFFNNYARNGAGQTTVIVYDPTARTLTLKRTGQADVICLTECDSWSYQLCRRAPDVNSFTTNIMFYPTTKASECKLVQMSWKCTRTIKGSKMNSESVQTAQIVLRNKTQ